MSRPLACTTGIREAPPRHRWQHAGTPARRGPDRRRAPPGTARRRRIAGYNLVYALNLPSPAYMIPSGPFFQFLAALVYNTPVLTVLILGTFLFWSLPSMIANTYMPIRSFFAWSFDRLMPEGLAKVNERTHSPVTAILTANVIIALVVIWSVYSHSFQLVLGMIVLAGALAVIIVGAAAIALPRRRPDLYQSSPANVNWFGVPVLYITGALSIIEFLIIIGIAFKYRSEEHTSELQSRR